MNEISIKDIEMLNNTDQDIIRQKEIIQELPEVKELDRLQHEKSILKNKIENYSTYNSIEIGKIIAKLMSVFEGIDYYFSKRDIFDIFTRSFDYKIEAFNKDNIYPNYFYVITNIKQKTFFWEEDNQEEKLCYLPPSSYSDNSSLQSYYRNNNLKYIQVFVDFLYNKRSSEELKNISLSKLDEILNEFLEVSSDLQQKRKQEIEDIINKRIMKQQRKEFENSCVIDRMLIFNSLLYIINHYENDMSARLDFYEEWDYGNQWSELEGYHKLIINYNGMETIYKTLIDTFGCYPDEEYCFSGAHINPNQKTDIPFFELKDTLYSIIKHSTYLKDYFDMLEELYNNKKEITSSDVQEILILLSNKNKENKKVLLFTNK